MSTDNPTIIAPRRNFLIRALGFTAAGATLPISIITADDARARMEHHQRELERAWADYYGDGPDYFIRKICYIEPAGAVEINPATNRNHRKLSTFMICSGGERIA